MKKLSIYLSIILALFALLYYLNWLSESKALSQYTEQAEELYKTTPRNLKPETRNQLDDPNYQRIIIPEDLDQKLNDGEALLVYYFSPLCSFCVQTTPILNEIAEEVDVEYVQMNVYQFEKEWGHRQIEWTPTLIYYEGGVEVDRLEGGISNQPGNTREDFKQFLLKYGGSSQS